MIAVQQVLRQRQWRLMLSLLAMAVWMLGTNFCALGLMARPCSTGAVPTTASACPHCPVKPATSPTAPCCQEVRAELPPMAVTALPMLSPVAVPTNWPDVFSLALATLPEMGANPGHAFPEAGPPGAGRIAMQVLLGRCAPVHAPPVLG